MGPEDWVLGLDTSGESFSLALLRGRRVVAECCAGQPRQHLVQLFPALELLCEQAGISLGQLQGVAVTAGPGSFTGVRTGLLVARTLGQVLNIPLYPLDTLEVLATQAGEGLVAAALDARKGEVVWGLFRLQQGRPRPMQPSRLDAPSAFVEALPAGVVVLGSACATYGALLGARSEVRVAPADQWRVRAGGMARLLVEQASQAWSKLRPQYVRPADVQVHSK